MSLHRLMTAGIIVVGLSGCGSQVCSVSGNVAYKGRSVAYGSVEAIGKSNQLFHGAIEPNGSYSIRGIPRDSGELKLAVHSPDPKPEKPMSARMAKGIAKQDELAKVESKPDEQTRNWFAIPEKYSKFEESGLSVKIDGKSVTYDIELK